MLPLLPRAHTPLKQDQPSIPVPMLSIGAPKEFSRPRRAGGLPTGIASMSVSFSFLLSSRIFFFVFVFSTRRLTALSCRRTPHEVKLGVLMTNEDYGDQHSGGAFEVAFSENTHGTWMRCCVCCRYYLSSFFFSVCVCVHVCVWNAGWVCGYFFHSFFPLIFTFLRLDSSHVFSPLRKRLLCLKMWWVVRAPVVKMLSCLFHACEGRVLDVRLLMPVTFLRNVPGAVVTALSFEKQTRAPYTLSHPPRRFLVYDRGCSLLAPLCLTSSCADSLKRYLPFDGN